MSGVRSAQRSVQIRIYSILGVGQMSILQHVVGLPLVRGLLIHWCQILIMVFEHAVALNSFPGRVLTQITPVV